MTTYHIFYIPLILFVGTVIGFALGKRAALAEAEQNARKERRKAMRAESLKKKEG